MTPDRIFRGLDERREIWLLAIDEEARHDGVLSAIEPIPENVAALCDTENFVGRGSRAPRLGHQRSEDLARCGTGYAPLSRAWSYRLFTLPVSLALLSASELTVGREDQHRYLACRLLLIPGVA